MSQGDDQRLSCSRKMRRGGLRRILRNCPRCCVSERLELLSILMHPARKRRYVQFSSAKALVVCTPFDRTGSWLR
jgi:hypothetical protein